jgi:hypothetical protein
MSSQTLDAKQKAGASNHTGGGWKKIIKNNIQIQKRGQLHAKMLSI